MLETEGNNSNNESNIETNKESNIESNKEKQPEKVRKSKDNQFGSYSHGKNLAMEKSCKSYGKWAKK